MMLDWDKLIILIRNGTMQFIQKNIIGVIKPHILYTLSKPLILTLSQKSETLEISDHGENGKSLSMEYHMGKFTITGIKN